MMRHVACGWIVAAAAWLCTQPAAAQMVRLPPVGYCEDDPADAGPDTERPLDEGYPGRLTSYPDSAAELPERPLVLPGAEAAKTDPDLPPDARPGIFQKAIFSGTWLAPGGSDGLGLYELDLRTVLAFPFPLPKSHLVITPGFVVHYLDGPANVDLPPRLYDAWASLRVMYPASPTMGLDVGVTPSVSSDFQQSSSKALRTPAHAAAMITWTSTLKILLGVAYLDREDYNFFPLAGLVWTPNEDWKFELVVPRPRIARRLYWGKSPQPGVEQWFYLTGELGGGSWAVRRADGANDVVTLSDWRVMVGWERTAVKQLCYRVEVGYVFGRKIEYTSDTPDFDPADTVLLRGGLTY
jgi:hypothetical protein